MVRKASPMARCELASPQVIVFDDRVGLQKRVEGRIVIGVWTERFPNDAERGVGSRVAVEDEVRTELHVPQPTWQARNRRGVRALTP